MAEKPGLTSAQFWPLINCAWFGIVTGGWILPGEAAPKGYRRLETPEFETNVRLKPGPVPADPFVAANGSAT